MLGACPGDTWLCLGGWAQPQSQELMGCVHFSLAGNTARYGESLAGTYWAVGPGLVLRFLL